VISARIFAPILFAALIAAAAEAQEAPDLKGASRSRLVPGRINLALHKKCYLRLINPDGNVYDKKLMKGATDSESYMKRLAEVRKLDHGHILGRLLTDGKFGYGESYTGFGWDRQRMRIDIDLGRSLPVGEVALHLRDGVAAPVDAAHNVFVLLSDDPKFLAYAVRGPFWGSRHVITEEPLSAANKAGIYRERFLTVLLPPADVRARYVRIVTDSFNWYCDEIEVLCSFKRSGELAKPVGWAGPYFCPYYPRLRAEVADVTTFVPVYNLTRQWDGGDPWRMNPVIDVPKGVEIPESTAYKLTKTPVKIAGKPYVRYRLTGPTNAFYWRTELPEGDIGAAWISDARTGDPYRQKIELISVRIPACPFVPTLQFGEWRSNRALYADWPGFLDCWWKLGMTEIPLKHGVKPWQENRRAELEKFSRRVIGTGYNVDFLFESFLHEARSRAQKDPTIRRAVLQAGNTVTYPCPLEIIEKMDDLLYRFLEEPARLGITSYRGDWEAEYGRLGCFCPVCCKRFKAFCAKKYPALKDIDAADFARNEDKQPREKWRAFRKAWVDFTTDIGARMWKRVYQGVKDINAKAGRKIEPVFRFYAVPYCKYPYIRDYEIARAKGILNRPYPYCYSANPLAYDWSIGVCDMPDPTDMSAGLAGPRAYGPRRLYYISLEAFSCGMLGSIWFPPDRIYGRTFVDQADATRQGALVADILEHSRIFPELIARRKWARYRRMSPAGLGRIPPFSSDAVTASDGTRVVGCMHRQRPGEKIVLVTRYHLRRPHETKVRVPVEAPSLVIDLYDRSTVATLKPGGNIEFPTTLTPPDHEARMFLIVPLKDAWRYSAPLLGRHDPAGDVPARPRLQWFAPAVRPDKFILELSRNREMKNAARRELLPKDTQTEKSGLHETALGEEFRSGTFYWRIGATNTYCAKYVFSDIVKAAVNQAAHP